jgi:hypothetical protein
MGVGMHQVVAGGKDVVVGPPKSPHLPEETTRFCINRPNAMHAATKH